MESKGDDQFGGLAVEMNEAVTLLAALRGPEGE